MCKWRDINRDSWTFTEDKIAGYGGGIGVYKISYAINLEHDLILNGKISADLKISDRHLTGAGLVCRADDLWTFLAFYTAPETKEDKFTRARLGLFKQGLFNPIFTLDEEVYLDKDYNQFSLEWFSGEITGQIKTSQKLHKITYTCPHIPFPGYAGLVKFYGTGVTAKNVQIETIMLPRQIETIMLPGQKFKYQVFICHSSKDKPTIEKIVKSFKQEGITYWFDDEQIKHGDPIIQKIEEGLQNSKYVMPCLSKNFNNSGWARAEYSSILNPILSGNLTRSVVPLQLDNCSNNNIPLLLQNINRAIYSNQESFSKLLNQLKS